MKRLLLSLFILCSISSPVFASQFSRLTTTVAETDPQVGATDVGEFCVGDGSAVQCNVPGSLSDDDLSNNVINDLSDVTITLDSAGQILVRNAGDTAYENVSVSGDATITAAGVVSVSDDSHSHTGATISGIDISDDTNLAATAPIVLTGDTLSLTQNAGTDVTADLEEETHATEHAIGGADEVQFYGEVQDEDSALTRRRFLNFEGAGVSCADDTTKTTCTIAGSGSATITVEEGDVTVSAAITDLDFQLGFDVTESPAGEANISLDLSEVAGGGDLTWSTNTPTIAANAVALSTDTTGDYVMTVADGTGIDGTATGEGSTYTPSFDSTELTNLTWSDGISASIVWTFDVSGTDTTATAGSGLFSFSHDIAIFGDNIEATTETDRFVFMANGSTYAPEAIDLGTDTVGNFVASVATTSPLTGGAAGSEGATLTLSITADGITATQIDETSNYTFTGALINQGTNPTVDATGEIGQDTTDNQLLYGSAPNVLSPKRSKTFRIDDLTATDDNFLFWNSEANVTITDISCKYVGTGTTPATFTLEDDDGNAMTISGTNPTCTAEGTESTFAAVTAGNALLSGEGIRFDVTNTPAPTTDDYIVTVKYTTDRT